MTDCQHLRIDNETWKCVACREAMVLNHWVESAKSLPTLVLIDVTYDCARCYAGDCGRSHRGNQIRLIGADVD